jgi:hypothetical protein
MNVDTNSPGSDSHNNYAGTSIRNQISTLNQIVQDITNPNDNTPSNDSITKLCDLYGSLLSATNEQQRQGPLPEPLRGEQSELEMLCRKIDLILWLYDYYRYIEISSNDVTNFERFSRFVRLLFDNPGGQILQKIALRNHTDTGTDSQDTNFVVPSSLYHLPQVITELLNYEATKVTNYLSFLSPSLSSSFYTLNEKRNKRNSNRSDIDKEIYTIIYLYFIGRLIYEVTRNHNDWVTTLRDTINSNRNQSSSSRFKSDLPTIILMIQFDAFNLITANKIKLSTFGLYCLVCNSGISLYEKTNTGRSAERNCIHGIEKHVKSNTHLRCCGSNVMQINPFSVSFKKLREEQYCIIWEKIVYGYEDMAKKIKSFEDKDGGKQYIIDTFLPVEYTEKDSIPGRNRKHNKNKTIKHFIAIENIKKHYENTDLFCPFLCDSIKHGTSM